MSPIRIPFDSKYSWIICFAGLLVNVFAMGQVFSYALYFDSLLDAFNRSESTTSWAGSICLGVLNAAGVLSGKLISQFGVAKVLLVGGFLVSLGLFCSSFVASLWAIYFTYGVLIGLGSSFCYLSTIVAVGQTFDKRKSTASGIVLCGSGIGSLVLTPLLNTLIPRFGWRGALRIQSGIMLGVVIIAFFIFHLCGLRSPAKQTSAHDNEKPSESVVLQRETTIDKALETNDLESQGEKQQLLTPAPHLRSFRELLADRKILMTLIGVCIDSFGYFIPFVYLVKFGESGIGLSHDRAVWAVSILGGVSAVGRVAVGYLSDLFSTRRLLIFVVSIVLNGVAALLIPFVAVDFATLLVISALFGLTAGAFIALVPAVVEEQTSKKDLPKALGLYYSVQAPAVLVGPPLAGLLVESRAGFQGAFLLAGIALIVGSIPFAALPFFR